MGGIRGEFGEFFGADTIAADIETVPLAGDPWFVVITDNQP